MSESYSDMQARIFTELVGHLGDGPYMGELEHPTMLDFAIFPQIVFGYMFGLEENLRTAMHPDIKAWLKRVAASAGKSYACRRRASVQHAGIGAVLAASGQARA